MKYWQRKQNLKSKINYSLCLTIKSTNLSNFYLLTKTKSTTLLSIINLKITTKNKHLNIKWNSKILPSQIKKHKKPKRSTTIITIFLLTKIKSMKSKISLNSNLQNNRIFWEYLKRKLILVFMILLIISRKSKNTNLNCQMVHKKFKSPDMKKSSFLQERIKLRLNL